MTEKAATGSGAVTASASGDRDHGEHRGSARRSPARGSAAGAPGARTPCDLDVPQPVHEHRRNRDDRLQSGREVAPSSRSGRKRKPWRANLVPGAEAGHTIFKIRVNAPRWSRSGVSHAVWRHGSSATPSFAAGAPARASSRWSNCPRRSVPHPPDAPVARVEIRCSTFGRGAVAVLCRSNRLSRPTSSSLNASFTSLSRSARSSRVDERRNPEVVGWPRVRPLLRAGRDQPDVARGLGSVPRAGERDEGSDAGRVVVRPGRGRHTVRVRHRDHQAVVRESRIPVTSLDGPFPGTLNRSYPTLSPTALNRAATR